MTGQQMLVEAVYLAALAIAVVAIVVDFRRKRRK